MNARNVSLLAALAATLAITPEAAALYSTDAFSKTPKPSVRFDAATRTWTLQNGAIRRSVHYDAESGGLVPVGFEDLKAGGPTLARIVSEGSVTLSPRGNGDARVLDLGRSWTLDGHESRDGALTVHLRGYGSNAGFELNVRYKVMPGDEPVLEKSIAVSHLTSDTWLLSEVVYDVLEIPAGAISRGYTGSGIAVSNESGTLGIAADVLSWQGASRLSDDGRRLEMVYRGWAPVPPGQAVRSPVAMLAAYPGPVETGAFVVQLYVGRHVSHATPRTVPPLYSTWFGYYNDITADLVLKLVPRAAALGAKVFSVDDGWQAIGDGTRGGYGDWIVNKTRFPDGLKPISDLARKHGMTFGLWSAPIMAHTESNLTKEHPEYLVKFADGSGKPLWDGTSAHCFAGEYAKRFTRTLLGLVDELNIGYVKIDGGLFVDGCVVEEHGHPKGHSEGAQVAAWEDLCKTLRKERPGIIISRGWEGEPGLTALQDSGWFGDWAVAFRPDREADRRWWYRNADIYRRSLYDLTATRPPFTISWEAPCHVLCKPVDLNALEYHLTSIGAYVCNLEIHGRILEMTPEEEAITRKWMKWNWENRDWLAVTQPITELGKPYDAHDDNAVPRIDGVMHLRNALKGRYGYVCLWNPSDKEAEAVVNVIPSRYFVKMDTATVRATRLKDGTEASVGRSADAITLRVPMAPLSWEIIELRKP